MKKMKKIVSVLMLCGVLVSGGSVKAFADSGKPFEATIKPGTAGRGVVKGWEHNKYYHLTPGRAGVEVDYVSGGSFEIYLYKGGREIDRCINIRRKDWRRFYNIPKDSSDYWLEIAALGKTNVEYKIKGKIHDHGDPQ